MPIQKICHPDDIQKYLFNVESPDTYTFDWRMICAEGNLKWIQTTKIRITDNINKVTYIIAIGFDITEKKEL